MMTPRERYMQDAQFHALVDGLRSVIDLAVFTPTEIRQAAMLAQIMYEETARPQFVQYGDDRTCVHAGSAAACGCHL